MSDSTSAFVPLPSPHGEMLRLLGPKPAEAAIAVDPLVRLDVSLTVVQSFIAGLCDPEGRLIVPLEIELVVDPGTVVPHKQVPVGALLRDFQELPAIRAKMPPIPGMEIARHALAVRAPLGPMVFCRKARRFFIARSPATGQPLHAYRGEDGPASSENPDLPAELLTWDGPAADHEPTIFGGPGGTTAFGDAQSLEQMLLAQGRVVQRARELLESDPRKASELGAANWGCQCKECGKHDEDDSDYKYALDRLAIVHAAEAPLSLARLGEWRLIDAARVVGGLKPSDACRASTKEENDFEAWRAARAAEMDTAGPAWLLSGETDGRELLEVARLKLTLIADVMEQLDAAWQAAERVHLCWTDETVRLMWEPPAATNAIAWGFRPVLRKVGMQPNAPFETPTGEPLVYPPAFSEPSLLPPEAVDAGRYFDEPRTATVFVKKGKPDGDKANAVVLVEELGVPWELFRTLDSLHVTGKGWSGVLSPCAERDKNDGDGLPFEGVVTGKLDGFKVGEEFKNCEVRWYPRFGEATDLHAVGMLLMETLLGHDERTSAGFREALLADRAELTKSCMARPIEQRDEYVRTWLIDRCETDSPASLWTRRNLLYRRDARNATRLDSFPPALWQAIMAFGLRLVMGVPGFSFCDDRAQRAPRVSGGLLLPLVELRGLIALLDDQIFGRTEPGAALRGAFAETK